MKLYLAFAALALALGGCNWSSQLDRDFGGYAVLAKDGASCTVTIPRKEPAP